MGVVTRKQNGKIPPAIDRLINETPDPPTRRRPSNRPSRVTKRNPQKAVPKKSAPAKKKPKKPAPKKPGPKKKPAPKKTPAPKPNADVHQRRGSPSSRVLRNFVPESQRSSLSSIGSREFGYRPPQQAGSAGSSKRSSSSAAYASPRATIKPEVGTPGPSNASHISREPAADRDDRNRSRHSRNFDHEDEEDGEIFSSVSPTSTGS